MLCTHKRVVGYKTGRFCKNRAILDSTHDTCEMCSLVTRNNWPRVISNNRKLTCIKYFCSFKSVILARLLLCKHFQILGSYFLPHTNTEILLDSYCGIIKQTGLFSPGLPNYVESVRVNIGSLVVRTNGRSVAVRSSDYKIFWDGYELLTHGAPQARARAPL